MEDIAENELKSRKFRRQRAGLTQHELSARLKISREKLRDCEIGVGKLTAEEHDRWERELLNFDPWFRAMAAFDGLKELYEEMRQDLDKLRQEKDAEIAKLQAQFMNAEMISTMRYRQIEELAERLERPQSPLIKNEE
jgi:transcriptional regulator with XRE-family HTH domain